MRIYEKNYGSAARGAAGREGAGIRLRADKDELPLTTNRRLLFPAEAAADPTCGSEGGKRSLRLPPRREEICRYR